jgi:hypothetical protein
MNVQNIKIRRGEEENVGAFGNWIKVKAIAVFDNVREYFKQIHVQHEQAKNGKNRSIKAHQQDILNSLPLEEKHSLGLYHLMDWINV